MGEMVLLDQVTKMLLWEMSLGPGISGPLVSVLVSICGMWHSAAVVVWLIDPGS